VDAATGTLRVRASFDNARRELFPGLFARVRVFSGEPRDTVMIAERAIGQDQGQRYVFVVDEKNTVEYRRIEAGAQEGELRIVEKGLTPGEWVIVNGLQRVRPGVTVAPQRVEMTSFVEAPETGAADAASTETQAPPAESK
jgi:multidrug efflux system membrane fusion protein